MDKTEKELIKLINNSIKVQNKDVIVGIGDDCAVIDFSKTLYELISTDMIVENIDFDLKLIKLEQVGYKAVACNVSDICAMGGYPEYIVVSLAIPDKLSSNDIKKIYICIYINKKSALFTKCY